MAFQLTSLSPYSTLCCHAGQVGYVLVYVCVCVCLCECACMRLDCNINFVFSFCESPGAILVHSLHTLLTPLPVSYFRLFSLPVLSFSLSFPPFMCPDSHVFTFWERPRRKGDKGNSRNGKGWNVSASILPLLLLLQGNISNESDCITVGENKAYCYLKY